MIDSNVYPSRELFKRFAKNLRGRIFRGWLRRRFRAQAKSTRFGISAGFLNGMRIEIEQNHEWAHASVPSVRDSLKRLWLWLWLRRRIRSAPPTPPYMKKVGKSWVEVPKESKEDCLGTFVAPDYWKTHEPVFTPRSDERITR